ncbi:hypothetical protein GW17_00026014 [Ensete ventricosum]|nr:hypothetical protein GW17_00026014 [Ensete ventricosum]
MAPTKVFRFELYCPYKKGPMAPTKVFRFELYRTVWTVHIGPIGYWYADRLLSGGTIEIGVSPCRNKMTPRLPARDKATPHLPARTRRRLVFPRGDEAPPPLLPARRRGAAASSPHPPRSHVSFSREARRRYTGTIPYQYKLGMPVRTSKP